MYAQSMGFESYPEWYRVEKETEKVIKKLTTLKELSPYLTNSDEHIRRLAILRINELRLKDSMIALKDLLDDPLETTGNKELAAWTMKVVTLHWNIDLFITNKYLNKYSGKERFNDVCKISIKDTLPSLRFDFTSSMFNSELNLENNDIRSSKDIDFDLPFSVKEWFQQYSHDILTDLKALLIRLPVLLFKVIKHIILFIFAGLVFVFKSVIGFAGKVKSRRPQKVISNNNDSANTEKISSSYSNSIEKIKVYNPQGEDLQSLRNSYNGSSYYENPYKEKISLTERVKKIAFSFAFILCTPIRLVIQHKKVSILGVIAIYLFLCFSPYGKSLTYKYTGLDLMEQQTKIYNTVKGIVLYSWDELKEIMDINDSAQPVAAQTETTNNTEDLPEVGTQLKYIITARSGLNLREGPDPSSKRLLQIPFESIVTKEAENGIWYKIKTSDGISGWVSSKYLKEFRGE